MRTDGNLKIAILGIGAMGCLFGSRLSGHADIWLVGTWPKQIEVLQRDGLEVTAPDGTVTHCHLNVTPDLARVPASDVVLVLVKSYQTLRAARQAAYILKTGGVAITLQNGLGNREILADEVGAARAVLGVTAQGATVLGPGRLRHAGDGPTHLARVAGQESNLRQVSDLFNEIGLETTVVDGADSLVWGKLAINAGINPLTALLGIPNGALVEDDVLSRIMAGAAQEVADIAQARDIRLPYEDAARRTAEVSRATAANRSSMLQDVDRGAPTEIDAISGAVVQAGVAAQVPTPINQFLWRLMKEQEAGQGQLTRQQIKKLAALQLEIT
jgi:2-dehydropantoate 2-reductase